MRNQLISIILLVLLLPLGSVLAGGGDPDDDKYDDVEFTWEVLQSKCREFSEIKQSGSYPANVHCSISTASGTLQESQVKKIVQTKKLSVERLTGVTFGSTKGGSNITSGLTVLAEKGPVVSNPVIPEPIECTTIINIEPVQFKYERPDTCNIALTQPTPEAFCNHVYQKVFTEEERAISAQAPIEKVSTDCEDSLVKDGVASSK